MSKKDKVLLADDLGSKAVKMTPLYTEVLCRNKSDTDSNMNSSFVIWDGTNWNTRTGKTLSSLPWTQFKVSVTADNCSCTNNIIEIGAKGDYHNTITSNDGYVITKCVVKEDGKVIQTFDGSIEKLTEVQVSVKSVKGDLSIIVTAEQHSDVILQNIDHDIIYMIYNKWCKDNL